MESEKEKVYINRHSLDRIIQHNLLSINELKEWKYVAWYDDTIKKYFSLDEIGQLCRLVTVEWPEEMIEKYQEHIDFTMLSQNQVIDFTIDLLHKYYYKWDWFSISENPQVYRCVGEDLMNIQHVDWNGLSRNSEIHWNLNFYKLYGARVDIWLASRFARVDWDVVKIHKSQFQKNWISSSGYKRIDGTYEPINYYSNGLICWCNNYRSRISISDFNELKEISVSTVENTKSMRDGWIESVKTSKLTMHMKESRILSDMSIEEIAEVADYVPEEIFRHYIVAGHNHLYDKIFVPYLEFTDRRNEFFGIKN